MNRSCIGKSAFAPGYIAECFSYDPATGEVRWKTRPLSHFKTPQYHSVFNTLHAGKALSSREADRYISCHLAHRGRTLKLYAHRIAYCLQLGCWPDGHIDHIDGNPRNNAWSNLRAATLQQNFRNTATRKHNAVGLKWVQRSSDGKRFVARATINRKTVHLGTFDTALEAHQHAVKRLSAIHGEFLNAGVAA